MPTSSSCSAVGSSSTTIAMFCIASRKRVGNRRRAPRRRARGTRRASSSSSRVSARRRSRRRRLGAERRGSTRSTSRTAQRSQSGVGRQMRRPCRISVSDARVQRSGGSALVERALRPTTGSSDVHEADPVGHAQHVAIDRQARHAERVAEHDVRGLAADAGQRRRARPCRPAPCRRDARRARAPCRRGCATSCGRTRSDWICGSSSSGSALRERRGVRIAREERRRDLVHARVGATAPRGSSRRAVRTALRKLQLGARVGMLRLEAIEIDRRRRRDEQRAAPWRDRRAAPSRRSSSRGPARGHARG